MTAHITSTESFDIDRLVNPMGLTQFLEEHWQKRELLISRSCPGYFADLLTISELDELIATHPIPSERVNLGRAAIGVPPQEYADADYVRPQDVLRLHAQGNTIILRAMHLFVHRLRNLCEATGRFFHAPSQANIYITPGGTQSSYPHWDAHDIFVIQIAGKKTWRLFESDVQQPLYTFEFDRMRHKIGRQIGELTLYAGDLAYIPRGLGHDPIASEYSVHISLGVLVKTWADVFAMMFEHIVSGSVEARTALPVLFEEREFDTGACQAIFPSVAAQYFDPENMLLALKRITAELRSHDRQDVRGVLRQIALDPSSPA